MNNHVLQVIHEFLPTQAQHLMTTRAVDLLRASSWSHSEAIWNLSGQGELSGVLILNPADPVQLLMDVDVNDSGVRVTGVRTEWYWDDARTVHVMGRVDQEWARGEKTLHELIVEVMRDSPSDIWTPPTVLSFPIPSLADLRSIVV